MQRMSDAYLNTGSVKPTSKLLKLTFLTLYDRNCQILFINTPI